MTEILDEVDFDDNIGELEEVKLSIQDEEYTLDDYEAELNFED